MICVSVCAKTAVELAVKIEAAEIVSDVIELRFDCLDPSEIDIALNSLPRSNKPYIITYRPSEEGGKRVLPRAERIKFWIKAERALADFDYFADHEADLGIAPAVPAERSIVSIHDFARMPRDVVINADALSIQDGAILKIAAATSDAVDAIPLWKILSNAVSTNRKLIPIGMGEAGKWTRILGLAHGAYMGYASLEDGQETAPGQFTTDELTNVFRINEISTNTEVYGVIAGETGYSMSPYIHNAAFKAAGMDRVFVPIQVADLTEFIDRMVRTGSREIDLNFHGFSVTNPHKRTIMELLDDIDDAAAAIGAANTVQINEGRMRGFNTDAAGFIRPLFEKFGNLADSSAVVVGAGGAARACVYALIEQGVQVTVAARDPYRADELADQMGVSSAVLSSAVYKNADIVVNATPVGTAGELVGGSVAETSDLEGVKLVYDLTYNPAVTRLIENAKLAGCETLGGLEMLLHQAVEQFRIWTGTVPDIDQMRSAAFSRLERNRER